ncbi:UNVERIFIED_ORG: transposase [Peribacillus simplex]
MKQHQEKQAPMVWADVGMYEVDGSLLKVYAFNRILSYSRMKYVEFTTDMKLEVLMKAT